MSQWPRRKQPNRTLAISMFYLKKETSRYIRDFSYKQPFFASQIKKDAGKLQGQEEVRLQQNPGVSAGTGHVRKEQWKN